MKVVLTFDHIHAGVLRTKGTEFEVDEASADWLKKNRPNDTQFVGGTAKQGGPAVPALPASKE